MYFIWNHVNVLHDKENGKKSIKDKKEIEKKWNKLDNQVGANLSHS